MPAPLRVGLLVEPRYLAQAQPKGMIGALWKQGHRVYLLDADGGLFDTGDLDLFTDLDVLVARGRTTSLLARLSAAELRGLAPVNGAQAIGAVVDKAHMAVRLRAAGIAAPQTWIGPFAEIGAAVPEDAYPLILKPAFGDNGRDIQVVPSRHALSAVSWSEPVVVAQRFIPNDGFDLKLYVIGEEVWAVRKTSPLRWGPVESATCRLEEGWRELALECGELFGLRLYGVDCIETPFGLQVIEVNDFPNYTGVPEADDRLARFVAGWAMARSGS